MVLECDRLLAVATRGQSFGVQPSSGGCNTRATLKQYDEMDFEEHGEVKVILDQVACTDELRDFVERFRAVPMQSSYTMEVNVQVFIATVEGKTVVLDLQPDSTIQSLKIRLRDKEGIRLENQRLIFDGKQMCDDHTLNECRIRQASTVYLLCRMHGGMMQNEEQPMALQHPPSPSSMTQDMNVSMLRPKQAGTASTGHLSELEEHEVSFADEDDEARAARVSRVESKAAEIQKQ